MKKNSAVRFTAGVLTALLIMPASSAWALPIVAGPGNETVENAEAVDDAAAVKKADEKQKGKKLADPRNAAEYLLLNQEDVILHQIPTDAHDTTLPEKFDLRDKGVVTPVKLQNPWGTCWGFSAIAASETSILTDMGKTYAETGLDLSEHHLTYFARTCLQDGSSQDGEGIHMLDEADTLNTGGGSFTACSVFSSGIGPVDESLIPYRGTGSKTDNDFLFNYEYSAEDDWSIPADYEFVRSYALKESNELPSPAVYSADLDINSEEDEEIRAAAYLGYDASATDIWKRELMRGRAISISFAADQYMPGQDISFGTAMYMNTEDNKWTHYTFDGGLPDHAVTVVGWDDTIPASDFLDHTEDEYGDGLAHLPEGDGAWIVKNSWGASTEAFPNAMDWGIQNEEGKSTGYFYISYYDRSLYLPETFDYDLDESGNDAEMVDQYNYLQSDITEGWADEHGLQMANVFTAEEDGDLRAVSCQTDTENISTTYQIYLLRDDAVTPDDGTLAAAVTADYAHAGYHKTALETPVHVAKGQKYSVVVTSCFVSGDATYYDFSTTTAENEAYVKEYNRKLLYRNRGRSEEEFEGDLKTYYAKGIVNPGESFVYMDALGQWGDFGEIIPYLQQDEQYMDVDFDNFPIKAVLTYTDPAKAAAAAGEYMTTELNYAEEAGSICYPFLIKCAVSLLFLIFGIIYQVRRHKKKKKQKKQIAELEKKVALQDLTITEQHEKIRALEADLRTLKEMPGDTETEFKNQE